MRAHWILVRSVCALILVAVPAVAKADGAPKKQDAPKPDAPKAGAPEDPKAGPREAAQSLLQEGNQLVGSGDYVEALGKFEEAYKVFPSPKLLLNIGTTQRLLGRSSDAAATYERYLADPEHDPKREAEVKRIIGEIDAVVSRIKVKVTTPGAGVKVDGKEIGKGPIDITLRVDPGEHTVVAEKSFMSADVETVTVKPGEALDLDVEPAPPGVVTKTERIESGSAQRIAGIVIGSAGIASAGVGAVFGGLAIASNNSAKKECSKADPTLCSARGVDLGKSASTKATVSTATLITGAGLFTVGTILFFTAPTGKKKPKDSAPKAHASRGEPWRSKVETVDVWLAPRLEGGVEAGWGARF